MSSLHGEYDIRLNDQKITAALWAVAAITVALANYRRRQSWQNQQPVHALEGSIIIAINNHLRQLLDQRSQTAAAAALLRYSETGSSAFTARRTYTGFK